MQLHRGPVRAGFTLMEVVIALMVSAIVLLGARAMLSEVGDDAVRISAQTSRIDANANAERTMRALVHHLDLNAGESSLFAGDARQSTFASWCDVPAGWQERCAVSLVVEARTNGDALVIRTSNGASIVVRDGIGVGSLRYLTTVSGGGEWIRVWGAGITAPLAIGIILDRDTLIVPIGERG